MKHNWEYKRLGDVCEIYQPQTISTQQLVEDGEFDVFGANGIIGRYDKYNHEFPEILLTCRGATCGTINVSNPKSWINGNAMVIHSKMEGLLFNYLKYCLTTLDYVSIISGAAQPQITRKSLSPVSIPIPPRELQEQIVAELDEINEGIVELREQVKDLDSLAQTLFYETFGDPISNPKGWPVKKLAELVTQKLSYGSGASGKEFDGIIRYIRITDIDENGKLKDEIACSPSEYDPKYELKEGDILFARSGATVGKTFLYNNLIGRSIYAGYLIKASVNKDLILPIYLNNFSKTLYYWNYIKKSIRGAAQPNINAKLYGNIPIPVPPLALQQQFAEQIEEIEAMKRELEAQIAEAQTLLDSRMDYWFN